MFEDFLEEVKLFIHRQGFTQSKVADALGVTEGTVSRWLSGTRKMTVDTFLSMLSVVGAKEIVIK